MFRSCSGKQTVQAVVLLLLLSPWVFGGGGTSFGQGAERVRLKALPTLSRIVRASVTSALPGGEARVSLITDEWLAVPLKGGEDKSPKNGPTGSTAPPGKWLLEILNLILCLIFSTVLLMFLKEMLKKVKICYPTRWQVCTQSDETSTYGKSHLKRGNSGRLAENENSSEKCSQSLESVDEGKGVWDWLHDFDDSREQQQKMTTKK